MALAQEPQSLEAWAVPTDELRERLDRVRQAMAQEQLDLLLVYASTWQIGNVAYLANTRGVYRSVGKLLLIPLEDEPILLARRGEVPLDQAQSGISDVRPIEELVTTLKAVRDKLNPARIGHERNFVPCEFSMPLSLWTQITSVLDSNKIVGTEIVNRLKRVKSAAEIEAMREAGKIVDAGQHAVRDAIRVGATEMEVVGAGAAAMTALGAFLATDMHMGSGPYSALFHKKPGPRRLEDGDLLYCDIAPRYFGYTADICRTWALGDVSADKLKMIDTAAEACYVAIESAKPGVAVKEIDARVRNVIEGAGYGRSLTEHLGHGIGLDCSEPPTLSPADEWELEENMVLSLSAKIIVPEVGGVLLENNVVVTPKGGEILHEFDPESLRVPLN
jgi:Xaa-Pro aminopeptidase